MKILYIIVNIFQKLHISAWMKARFCLCIVLKIRLRMCLVLSLVVDSLIIGCQSLTLLGAILGLLKAVIIYLYLLGAILGLLKAVIIYLLPYWELYSVC